MKKKTNVTLLLAAIFLILLAVLSAGLAAYESFGLNRPFTPQSGERPSGTPGDMPQWEGNAPFGGDGQTAPGEGGTLLTPPADGQGRGQYGGPTGFTGGMPSRGGFYLLRYANLAVVALGLVLSVLAAIFVLKGKKWAAILAVVWAGVMLVVNAFSLFMRAGTLSLAVRAVCLALSLAVIVLLLLKKSRAVWAAPRQPALVDDDDDDDDDEEKEGAGPVVEIFPVAGEPDNASHPAGAEDDDDDEDD